MGRSTLLVNRSTSKKIYILEKHRRKVCFYMDTRVSSEDCKISSLNTKKRTKKPGSVDGIEDEYGKFVRLNVIILGEDGVGKSALTLRSHKGKFSKKHVFSTSSGCLMRKVDGKIVKFHILDTDESHNNYDIGQASIVVYDITNKDTFVHAQCLIRELRHYANSDILIALVGNKSDLESCHVVEYQNAKISAKKKGFVFKNLYETVAETSNMAIALADNNVWSKRTVKFEEVSAYAEENGLIFLETSAKNDQNVHEIFRQIAEKFYENTLMNPKEPNSKKQRCEER